MFALCVNLALGQNINKEYFNLTKKARSLYVSKNYKKSAKAYSKAFRVGGNKTLTIDRFKAARSCALASMPDSAFSQLDKIVSKGNPSDYSYLTQSEDLVGLHSDNRWVVMIETIERKRESNKVSIDKAINEQKVRMSHLNQRAVPKHLPIVKPLVKSNIVHPSSFALLADRAALRQGKKQIYGTQVLRIPQTQYYYVLPLEDPKNVDKRRAEIGLKPIAEYVSHWKIKWDSGVH